MKTINLLFRRNAYRLPTYGLIGWLVFYNCIHPIKAVTYYLIREGIKLVCRKFHCVFIAKKETIMDDS